MKKRLILLSFLMVILISGIAWAVPNVVLDDTELTFDVPPVIENGRTLVPLRIIFESLGANVQWDQTTQTVTAIKDKTIIKLTINSDVAYKNDQSIKIDVPAKIKDGRTMVPLRFVSEAMGAYVGWDSTTETINILKQQPQFLTVKRVIDGDTIELENGEKVRFIGVDTPESTTQIEAYGKEAANFTKSLLEDKKVWFKYDVGKTDKYGRTLAYVYTENGTFVNALLVAEGYAQIMTVPPNVKYQDVFLQLEQEARTSQKGLWGIQDEPQITSTNGTYIGSLKSDKYHFPDCIWAKKIAVENEIWFATAAEAKAHNYKPCGVCNPPEN